MREPNHGRYYSSCVRVAKRQIRRDKRNWSEEIAKEAEEAANMQNMKTLYVQLN